MDRAGLRRLIENASKQAGGDEPLAQRLGVTVETLESWAEGRSQPPPKALALLISIVFDPFRPTPEN
jgi:DNA-binding transcriptional regulator YdaS (Cro superfamily)